MKIAITGAHGSGKTTLALDIVSRLKKRGKNAVLMPEVARESPYLIAGEQCPNAQLQIFGAQIDREMRYERNSDILVIDRSIIDHLSYMKIFFPKEKEYIESMGNFIQVYAKGYTHLFRTNELYDLQKTDDSLRPPQKQLQTFADEEIKKNLDKYYPSYINLPKNLGDNLATIVIDQVMR